MWLIVDLGLRPVRTGGLDHAEDVDHVLARWA
ncbi:putative dinucleotide-binding enzyme [Nocardia sp. GAS34]